jgi:hypothetical protein
LIEFCLYFTLHLEHIRYQKLHSYFTISLLLTITIIILSLSLAHSDLLCVTCDVQTLILPKNDTVTQLHQDTNCHLYSTTTRNESTLEHHHTTTQSKTLIYMFLGKKRHAFHKCDLHWETHITCGNRVYHPFA